MEYKPHRQANSSLGKNLNWYSTIRAWLTIALVALVQRKLEWPKYWSHRLLLIVDSLKRVDLSSSNLRKFLSFRSDAWKVIFYCILIESQSHFLQKSQDNLHGKLEEKSKLLVSLSTKECSNVIILKSLELDKRTNSCIRVNTRKLDRELFTKQFTLYTSTDGLC